MNCDTQAVQYLLRHLFKIFGKIRYSVWNQLVRHKVFVVHQNAAFPFNLILRGEKKTIKWRIKMRELGKNHAMNSDTLS